MKHLDPLYESDNPMAFQSANEMIEHLADCFEELDEKADAHDAYAIVRQGSQERFRDFKIRFLDLANRAEVSPDTQLADIFRKSYLDLQKKLLSQRRNWTSLQQAIRALDGTDKELVGFRCRNRVRKAALDPSPSVKERLREKTPPSAPKAYVPPYCCSATLGILLL